MNLERLIKLLELNKVIKPSGCWETVGRPTTTGYSYVWDKEIQKHHYAHRISAVYYHGLDFEDKLKLVCHKNECNNRRCWNPEHIYVGDHRSNREDKSNGKTHCLNGHEFTPKNTRWRMNKRLCIKCNKIRSAKCNAERKKKNEEKKVEKHALPPL